MPNKQIKYGIGFEVDESGLQKLKSSLQALSQYKMDDLLKINTDATEQDLQDIQRSVSAVQQALDKSYNFKLDSTNVHAFNENLKSTGISVQQLAADFGKAGVQGQIAFRNLATDLLTSNTQLKQTHNLIDSMAETLGNTIKWSIASGAINAVTGSIQQAWGFTKKLDASLNDIRIVTGQSSDEMERFAKQANKAAKSLGSATTDYTNAALIYYQQGLKEEDVVARTDVTIKAANVTGQSAAEVSEQLTAVWNGYKVVAEEAELYVDKLAAVAASTAADLEELSTGMSKVASAAFTMGVDIDQLSAQLSTIVSVTRQDASLVGTALKTIYARMGDLKVSGIDEFGTSLGDVSSQLRQMGIDVLDQEGNLRDMGTVIEEVAGKWGGWTDAQRQAAAVAIAGKRQYNNLIALFDNWNMYESALTTSQASEGTLQKQQDTYMDSLEGRLNQLAVAGEKVYSTLFDSESMKDLISALTTGVDLLADFIDHIGGGGQLLANFGSIALTVFKKHLAGGIATGITNLMTFKDNTLAINGEIQMTQQMKLAAEEKEIPLLNNIIAAKQEQLKYARLLTAEQKQQWDQHIKMLNDAQNEVVLAEEHEKTVRNELQAAQELLKTKKILTTLSGPEAKAKHLNAGEALTQSEFRERKQHSGVHYTAGTMTEFKEFNLETEEGRTAAVTAVEERESQLIESEKNASKVLSTVNSGLATPEKREATIGTYSEEIDTFAQNYGGDPAELSTLLDLNEQLADAQRDYTAAKNETLLATQKLVEEEAKLKQMKEDGASETEIAAQEAVILNQKSEATATTNKQLKAMNTLNSKARKVAEEHTAVIQKNKKQLEGLTTSIRNYSKNQEKASNSTEVAKKKLQNLKTEMQRFVKSIKVKAIADGIVGVVSGLSQMASAISTLKNLGDIFNDDSMSGWEKMLAVTQNLGMALPMLVGGFGSVFNVMKSVVTVTNAAALAGQKKLILDKNLEKQQLKNALATALGTTAEEIHDDQIEESINNLNRKQFATFKATLATQGEAAANVVAATSEKTKGKASLWAGIQAFIGGITAQIGWWPFLLIALAIAAVLATIIALIAIFTRDTETGLEKANKALEKEKEDLAAINEQYKLMNEELQKVQESFDALAEKQKIINDLTVGTEDWTKAVQENNQAVMDLVSQYSELAGAVSVSDTGVMSITQEGQEVLEKKLNEKTQRAYANTIFQQAEVMKAQQKVDSLEAGKALGNGEDYDFAKHYNTEKLETILVESKSQEDLKKALIENGMATEESAYSVSAAMWAERDAIYENITSINNNSNAIKKLEAAYSASFFAENEDRAEAKSTAAWDAMMGNTITQNIKNQKGEVDEDKASDGKDSDELNADAKKNYAASLGVSENDLVFEDGKVKVKGADDSTFVSVETAAEQANKYASAEAAEKQAKEITEKVNKMYTAAEEAGNAGLANLAGGQKSVTFDENETTVSGMSKSTLEASRKAIFSELGGKDFDKLTSDEKDAIAKQLGYIDYADYNSAFEKTAKQAEATVNNIGAGNLNKDFNVSNFADATVTQAREISDAFETVFKSAGSSGTKALNSMLSEFSENPETQAKIASIASSIDWMDLNAENEFRAALEDAGVAVDEQSVYWRNIVNSMESAANTAGAVAYQYTKIRSQLAEIKSLTEDLETGEVIDDEDYKNLIKYNSKLKDMFIQTADGYKFIGGSAEEIKKIASEGYDDLGEVRSKYSTLSAAARNFKNKEFKVSNSSSTNIDTAGKIKAIAGYDQLLASQGINKDVFDEAYAIANDPNADTSSEDYKNAVTILRDSISAINQAKNDYELGLFDDSQAIEDWVSFNANGWKETKKLLEDQGVKDGNKTYEKFETQYKNQFLKELGLTLDSETVKKLNINNLETAVIAARKLELDYLQEINAEIEKNSALMETAFGSGMTRLLESQIERQKEAYSQAVLNKDWANTVLKTALESSGYKGKTLTELLNIRATSENAEEIENLDNIIELYTKADDAAMELIESSQAVIDAQIENYEYQLEMQDKITESLRRLRDLAIEFDDFATKGLSLFEEGNAVDTIKKSLASLEDNGKDLERTYGELNRYSQIAEIDTNYLNNRKNLKKLSNEIGIDYTVNRENDWKALATSYSRAESSILDGMTRLLSGVSREGYSFFSDTKNNPFYNAENGTFNSNAFEESFGEFLDEAHETLVSMREELQTLYDSYLQAQDEILELYDERIQKLSTINDIYSTMADLSAMVGKNTSQYYDNIVGNLRNSYNLAEEQYLAVKREYDKLFNLDGSRKAGISQEMYDKVADNLAAAATNLTDIAQQTLEAVANNFSAQIKETVDGAIKATTGLNLAAASESWELANAANEGYLDEVNARYNIDQLNRKIQTSIDESDNYAAQKKLADLRAKQEQRLNDILEERGKLSQYELDRANAEYELTLKQIALEEAQQTANKMKLTRDAMGNYTYQYVADQDAIAKAEEELAAAENNLYNIDKERNKSLVDEYYATMTEANEAIAEAMAQGDTERVERLREHYFGENGMIAEIQSELKASSKFLKEIGSLVSDGKFSDNITQVADQITSMKLSGEDGLFTKINKLIGEDGSGIRALSDATKTISDLLKGEEDGGILQTVVSSVYKTQKNATDLATEVTELSNASSAVIDKLPSLVENVKSLADELDIYASKYQAWLDAQVDTTEIEANTEALGDLTRSINELKDTLDNGKIDGSISIEGWSFDSNTWTQNVNNTK